MTSSPFGDSSLSVLLICESYFFYFVTSSPFNSQFLVFSIRASQSLNQELLLWKYTSRPRASHVSRIAVRENGVSSDSSFVNIIRKCLLERSGIAEIRYQCIGIPRNEVTEDTRYQRAIAACVAPAHSRCN